MTFSENGTFSTVRESKQVRLFHKVFVQTPISSGTWAIRNGTLRFHIQTSVHPSRVNHAFDFTVRSITASDFIFVDYLGRVGQATRVN